jgi:excisionase family DNA binding protein
MNRIPREIFTPAELAGDLGRSRSWVEERCKDGRLPALRDGGRWLLRRSDLIRTGWLTPPCVHEDAPVAAGASDGGR